MRLTDSGPVDELQSFVKIGDRALGQGLKGWRRRNRVTLDDLGPFIEY
jgi:hypothetical protein